jgi:diaminobutyrate-2-oxoglutarate transaminase
MPYDGYLGPTVDTLDLLATVLDDAGSGVDLPAAIVVETVQGEGGLAVASPAWLRRLADLARSHGILLVVDEIQTGCGRTGEFFGFEHAEFVPDIVCLSKSLSGIGLPLAVMLHRPSLDIQSPGEHSGTFRGNNLAFVSASAALGLWHADFALQVHARISQLDAWLVRCCARYGAVARGRGAMRGLLFEDETRARRISREAFERCVLVETSGASANVVKLMPPLTIPAAALEAGLTALEQAIDAS